MSPRDTREPGRVFDDAAVVRNYRYRRPYPDETLDVFERLLVAHEAWRGGLIEHHLEFVDLVRTLEASGHFIRDGERTAAPVPYEQSIDDHMAMLASTSSLSRTTLCTRADDFERDARALCARHALTRVRAELVAEVIWGRPR